LSTYSTVFLEEKSAGGAREEINCTGVNQTAYVCQTCADYKIRFAIPIDVPGCCCRIAESVILDGSILLIQQSAGSAGIDIN
jgi:hypothetical protein